MNTPIRIILIATLIIGGFATALAFQLPEGALHTGAVLVAFLCAMVWFGVFNGEYEDRKVGLPAAGEIQRWASISERIGREERRRTKGHAIGGLSPVTAPAAGALSAPEEEARL